MKNQPLLFTANLKKISPRKKMYSYYNSFNLGSYLMQELILQNWAGDYHIKQIIKVCHSGRAAEMI